MHEQIGIYDGGELLPASEPFSLQIGDWWWDRPAGEEGRGLAVLVELRADGGYVQDYFPRTRAWFCVYEEGKPDQGGELYPTSVLRIAPGVFRMIRPNVWRPDDVDCDLTDFDVPTPADGYTADYPCDNIGHFTDSIRRSLFAENGITLPPCRT